MRIFAGYQSITPCLLAKPSKVSVSCSLASPTAIWRRPWTTPATPHGTRWYAFSVRLAHPAHAIRWQHCAAQSVRATAVGRVHRNWLQVNGEPKTIRRDTATPHQVENNKHRRPSPRTGRLLRGCVRGVNERVALTTVQQYCIIRRCSRPVSVVFVSFGLIFFVLFVFFLYSSCADVVFVFFFDGIFDRP